MTHPESVAQQFVSESMNVVAKAIARQADPPAQPLRLQLETDIRLKRDFVPLEQNAEVKLLGEIRDILLRIEINTRPLVDPVVQAIRGVVDPGVTFSCAELIEREADNVALLAVIGTDPNALGRALGKCRGIVRLGKDDRGVIWVIPDDV
jgi:hypothetical protein